MTHDRMIADAVLAADELCDRFGRERILLPGHSWGSCLGIQPAAAAPHRFLAHVGRARIARPLRSEVVAKAHLLAVIRDRGDGRMIRRLEAAQGKGLHLFEAAAHSPLFAEPARAVEIPLTDVLRGTDALADARRGRAAPFGACLPARMPPAAPGMRAAQAAVPEGSDQPGCALSAGAGRRARQSTSTSAPTASAVTPIVVRAGCRSGAK
jgi:pimeloyl-ACP methyl ester carboxylesterase